MEENQENLEDKKQETLDNLISKLKNQNEEIPWGKKIYKLHPSGKYKLIDKKTGEFVGGE